MGDRMRQSPGPVVVLVVLVAVVSASLAAVPGAAPAESKASAPAQSRSQIAAELAKKARSRYQAGMVGIEEALTWMRRQYEAERDQGDGAALDRYLEALGSLGAAAQQRVQAGTDVSESALKVDYFRLEALAQSKKP